MYGLLKGTFRNKKNKVNNNDNNDNIEFKEEKNIISLINKGITEDECFNQNCNNIIVKIWEKINYNGINNCSYEKKGVIKYDPWESRIVNEYKISSNHTRTLVYLNKEEVRFIEDNKDRIPFIHMKIKEFYKKYKK